ncbi:Uncharacterised protein [uncultured archaeon]|nr:Uncharacterised protein [uncultured archaeon]
MADKKLKKFIPKLVLYSLVAGILVGVLELFIGHRFILDPLLYGKDLGFVYESYFAPTFYGMTKSIVVALTFFLTYIFTFNKKINLLAKSAIIGLVGTIIFGIYYYITFPTVTSSSGIIVGIVHFSFIAVISYVFAKLVKLK